VIVDAPTSPVLEVEIREDGYVFIVHDPAGASANVFSEGVRIQGD